MQNPERLVLDFTSARLATQKTTMPGVSAPVRGVRLGQYRPDVARIVVDLTAAAPYQILREGPAVVVAFDAAAGIAGRFQRRDHDGLEPLARDSNTTIRRRMLFAPSQKVSYRAPRFALPGELTQPSVVLASYSGKKDEPVRPIAAQEAAAQATAQAGNAAATVAPQTTAAPSRYTGEPISVNLKDVDLRDFFRLIHEISGLNVVLDPNVKGTLTIVLDEVPWDQALDIVLQNNGLDKAAARQRAPHRHARHHQEGSRDRARRSQGGKRCAGNDHRDPRAQLRQGGVAGAHAEEIPDRRAAISCSTLARTSSSSTTFRRSSRISTTSFASSIASRSRLKSKLASSRQPAPSRKTSVPNSALQPPPPAAVRSTAGRPRSAAAASPPPLASRRPRSRISQRRRPPATASHPVFL